MSMLALLGQKLASISSREVAPPPASASRPLAEAPLEHLRRAIAASKARDATAPSPAVFREIRLLLNQLESGRVSLAPSREVVRVNAPPPPEPTISALLTRKAQAAAQKVTRRLRAKMPRWLA